MLFSEQHLNRAGILSKPMQTCREKRLKQRAKEVSSIQNWRFVKEQRTAQSIKDAAGGRKSLSEESDMSGRVSAAHFCHFCAMTVTGEAWLF